MKIILGKKLFDYEEVSRMLSVNKNTVARYVKRDKVTPTVIERKKYLSEADVLKIIGN